MLSPQGQRGKRKQPKQKQPNGSGEVVPAGKGSPQIGGVQANPSASNNGTLPMKLGEIKENDYDTDTEERMQLLQDRMRLKKNISANGNYTMAKVAQPAQNYGQPPSTADSGAAREDLTKTRSQSQNNAPVPVAKPSFQGNNIERMKKNNLTASNPIIGAPLGEGRNNSMKVFPKLQAGGGIPKGGQKSQLSKPVMPGSAKAQGAPKFAMKKTLKFATDGPGSPEL
jgi:hypothetical protein